MENECNPGCRVKDVCNPSKNGWVPQKIAHLAACSNDLVVVGIKQKIIKIVEALWIWSNKPRNQKIVILTLVFCFLFPLSLQMIFQAFNLIDECVPDTTFKLFLGSLYFIGSCMGFLLAGKSAALLYKLI